MISCECREGECLHPGSFSCEVSNSLINLRQQDKPTVTQIIQQQQRQKIFLEDTGEYTGEQDEDPPFE